ncbi:Hypothetical_protein [Hexamita inflata]|uniref:Hypothetical_protein n=1 Tax=Hexamita inflata TaxID=28002 RepID=A0AA86NY40_9EUKA|nr:Hypothetical protein HINF_LOCUS15805 [Hexamita inflata]
MINQLENLLETYPICPYIYDGLCIILRFLLSCTKNCMDVEKEDNVFQCQVISITLLQQFIQQIQGAPPKTKDIYYVLRFVYGTQRDDIGNVMRLKLAFKRSYIYLGEAINYKKTTSAEIWRMLFNNYTRSGQSHREYARYFSRLIDQKTEEHTSQMNPYKFLVALLEEPDPQPEPEVQE